MAIKRKSVAPFITVTLESSGVPLYRQLYQTLRKAILSGQLSAESQMPSTRALSRQLAVSRMTVINAYDQLFAEGYIEGRSGSGTYVARVLPEELLEIKQENKVESKEANDDSPALSKRGKLLASFDRTHLRSSRTDKRFSAFHPGIPAIDAFPFNVWSRMVARRLGVMNLCAARLQPICKQHGLYAVRPIRFLSSPVRSRLWL
jgi:GntR family transcriptional regulator/MocR family aminotransferase